MTVRQKDGPPGSGGVGGSSPGSPRLRPWGALLGCRWAGQPGKGRQADWPLHFLLVGVVGAGGKRPRRPLRGEWEPCSAISGGDVAAGPRRGLLELGGAPQFPISMDVERAEEVLGPTL